MKKMFFVFWLLFLGSLLPAQTEPAWMWASRAGGNTNYYDEAKAIVSDSAGNSYITGHFFGTAYFGATSLVSAGLRDVFVAKLDPSGNWLWAVRGGGTGHDYGNGISLDNSGNIYITGSFYSSASFGVFNLNGGGLFDMYAAKLSSSGTWLWAKQAGSNLSDVGNGISTDADGFSHVTGYFNSTVSFGTTALVSAGSEDIYAAKLDPWGNWVWAKRAGGSGYDAGFGISLDTGGNSHVTGSFSSTASFGTGSLVSNSGTDDIFAAKLSPSGSWLWASGAGGANIDYGLGISTDSAGNSYLSGSFNSTASFGATSLTSAGLFDLVIAKLDPSGNWLWARRAGSASGNDHAYCVSSDASGNCYLGGYFTATALFGTVSLTSSGAEDCFAARLDSAGNWLWAKRGGGIGYDAALGVDSGIGGNGHLTGTFGVTASFGAFTITCSGMRDVFAALISPGAPANPDAPQNIVGTQFETHIALSWDAVTGAGGYRVYICDTPEGTYQQLLYVAGTSVDVTWAQIIDMGFPDADGQAFFRVTADTAAPR